MPLSFGDFLSGTLDQINPFDKGRTFSTKEKEVKVRDIANKRQSRRAVAQNIVRTPQQLNAPLAKPQAPTFDASALGGRSFADYDFRDAFFAARGDITQRSSLQIYDINNTKRKINLPQGTIANTINLYRGYYVDDVSLGNATSISVQKQKNINELVEKADKGDETAIDTLAFYKEAGILDDANLTERVVRGITKQGAAANKLIADRVGTDKEKEVFRLLNQESQVSGVRVAGNISDATADLVAAGTGASVAARISRGGKLAAAISKLGPKGQTAARIATAEIGAEAGVIAQDISAGQDVTPASVAIGLAAGLLPEGFQVATRQIKSGVKAGVKEGVETVAEAGVPALRQTDTPTVKTDVPAVREATPEPDKLLTEVDQLIKRERDSYFNRRPDATEAGFEQYLKNTVDDYKQGTNLSDLAPEDVAKLGELLEGTRQGLGDLKTSAEELARADRLKPKAEAKTTSPKGLPETKASEPEPPKTARLTDDSQRTTASEPAERPPKTKEAVEDAGSAKSAPTETKPNAEGKPRLLKPDNDGQTAKVVKDNKLDQPISPLRSSETATKLTEGDLESALKVGLSRVNSKVAFDLKELRRLAKKSSSVKEVAGKHDRLQLIVNGPLAKALKGASIDADDKFATTLLNRIYNNLKSKPKRTAAEEADFRIAGAVLQSAAAESGGQLANVKLYRLTDDKGRVKNITQETKDTLENTDISTVKGAAEEAMVKSFTEEATRLIKESGGSINKETRDQLTEVSAGLVAGLKNIKSFRNADGTINYSRMTLTPSAVGEKNLYDKALAIYKNKVDELTKPGKKAEATFSEKALDVIEETNSIFKTSILSGFSTPQSILSGNISIVGLRKLEDNLATALAKGYNAFGGKGIKGSEQTFATANALNLYMKNSIRGLSPKNIKRIRDRMAIYRSNAESAREIGSLADEIAIKTGQSAFSFSKPLNFFKSSVFAVLEVMDEGARISGRHSEGVKIVNEYLAKAGADFDGAANVRTAMDDIFSNDLTRAQKGWDNYDNLIRDVAEREGKDLDELRRGLDERMNDTAAKYAAANNDSWYGATEYLRKGANKIPGGALLAPIITAPGNIIEMAADFAPGIGLLKLPFDVALRKTRNVKLTPAEIITQRVAAQAISVSSLGTAGFLLYENDLLNLEYPTSQAEKDKWALEGREPYSIKTPLGWMDLGPFLPVMPGILLGANLSRKFNDELPGNKPPDWSNFFGAYVKSNFDASFEHPFLVSASLLEKGDVGKVTNQIASGFIPNFLKQIAKATDSTTPDPDSFWERIFIQNIPGLRNTIENKTVLGQEIQGKGLGALTPFGFTSGRTPDGETYGVDNEYLKHFEEGRFSQNISLTDLTQTSIMNILPGETKDEKEALFQQVFRGDNALDDQKIADMSKQIEQTIYNEWDKFIKTDQYKLADPADQKSLLIKVKNEVNSAKKKSILLQLGIQPSEPMTDNEKRILGHQAGDAEYYLGKQEKTRQQQIADIRDKIPDLRPAEVQAELRKINKLAVEIEFEPLGNVIDDYNDLSKQDLGRELQRIASLDGKEAAEKHFQNIVAFGDALFAAGGTDSSSQKYRDSKGKITYPAGYSSGAQQKIKTFKKSVQFRTPLEVTNQRRSGGIFSAPRNIKPR